MSDAPQQVEVPLANCQPTARSTLDSANEHAMPAMPAHPPADASELSLIGGLFSQTSALEDLARTHGLTLRDLLAWAERPDVLALRRSMREVADDRADLIVSRARTLAAHRLTALASGAANDETARKACVDLLRLRAPSGAALPEAPTMPDADPHDSASDTSDDDLLSGLEALARATHAPRQPKAAPQDVASPCGAD